MSLADRLVPLPGAEAQLGGEIGGHRAGYLGAVVVLNRRDGAQRPQHLLRGPRGPRRLDQLVLGGRKVNIPQNVQYLVDGHVRHRVPLPAARWCS